MPNSARFDTSTGFAPEPVNAAIERMNKERLGTAKGLVWGGAVYEGLYMDSFPRILFLMKEAHCQSPQEVWGMPWHLKNQVEGRVDGPLKEPRFYKTWRFLGCMMAGITGKMPSYQSLMANGPDAFDYICKQGLSKTAVLNIKKTPGTSESNSRELMAYLKEPAHSQLLMDELSMLAPQLVICSGNYDILRSCLPDVREREWPCGARTFITAGSNAVFLEFVHPSIRGVKRNVLYTYLQCACYDIMTAYGWLH
ncbi:MAG: hypothetical protein GXZ04_04150 [Clostridiales bacterium]|nr:hypothetical protein [Clostridiales bacterium]